MNDELAFCLDFNWDRSKAREPNRVFQSWAEQIQKNLKFFGLLSNRDYSEGGIFLPSQMNLEKFKKHSRATHQGDRFLKANGFLVKALTKSKDDRVLPLALSWVAEHLITKVVFFTGGQELRCVRKCFKKWLQDGSMMGFVKLNFQLCEEIIDQLQCWGCHE